MTAADPVCSTAAAVAAAAPQMSWQQRRAQGESYLSWACSHSHVRVHSTSVPDCLLPRGYQCTLNDVQVKVKYGPDDAIYDKHADLRKMVARGNTVLEVRRARGGGGGDATEEDPLSAPPGTYVALKALRKFTGGSGDDDDRDDSVEDQVWHQYFSKPIATATKLVRTRKANGEALHIAVIRLAGRDYFLGGSKNSHLLFTKFEDIHHYSHDRYRVARQFCADFLRYFDHVPEGQRAAFVRFLRERAVTAVFEILYKNHQHVELLTNDAPIPKFITFTSHDTDSESLSYMTPDRAIDMARQSFGLDPISYEVCDPAQFEAVCEEIRRGHGYEGEVVYFVSGGEGEGEGEGEVEQQEVIGLLKKKTAWYILIRALREKVKAAVSFAAKKPAQFDAAGHQKRIHKRVGEIQRWLGLSDAATLKWQQIGGELLKFCVRQLSQQRQQFRERVFDQFPVVWRQFLDETGTDDSVF